MRRRIALLVGTFLTLLLAYLVYHFSTGNLEQWVSASRNVEREKLNLPPPPPPPADSGGGLGVDRQGVGLRFENRDPKTGRLEGVYYFPRWSKQEDGSYLVEEPNVTIYHKGGERSYIFAESGRIELEELARQQWEVRNGELHGHVTIWFDRSPPPRVPVGAASQPVADTHERDRQIVRMYTDDIHLDNDRLMMYTDGRVVLFSDKADIFGTGLYIRWRDVPRELVRLQILRGGQMHVYEMPEGFGASLPGAGGGAGASGLEGPATLPAKAPLSLAAKSPQPRPSSGRSRTPVRGSPATLAAAPPAASLPSVPAASQPGPLPTGSTRPVSRSAIAARGAPKPTSAPQPNVYRAEFKDRVRVDYPIVRTESNTVEHGYVEGADQLALIFEWDANSRRRPAGGGEEDREARRGLLVPAPGASSTQASQPDLARVTIAAAGSASSVGGAGGLAGAQDTGSSAGKQRAKPTDPMIITWYGPLTLEPYGLTDEPSSREYEISAEGERVVLGDSRTLAVCQRFHYVSPAQEGELEGTDRAPARLLMADGPDGLDIVCGSMQYQRGGNVAWLRGGGHMISREGVTFADLQALADEPPLAEPDANLDSIRWRDSVEVTFAPDEPGLPAGRTPSIREANFQGDVRLTQPSSGDFVRCDALRAVMGRDANGRMSLQKAFATGGVSARQQGSHITAGRVIVTADPAPQGPVAPGAASPGSAVPGALAAAGSSRRPRAGRAGGATQFGRFQPRFLEAEGSVVVEDGNGPDRVVATADRLWGDLVRRDANLYGSPATITLGTEGTDHIEGEDIHLEEVADPNRPDQSASVNGPGKLIFLIDRDLNGTKLKMPRPVQITWLSAMDYSAYRNVANFSGKVQLNSFASTPEESGTDHMSCPTLQVIFEKAPPAAAGGRAGQAPRSASAPVAGPGRGPASPNPVAPGVRPSRTSSAGGASIAALAPGTPLESLGDAGESNAAPRPRLPLTQGSGQGTIQPSGQSPAQGHEPWLAQASGISSTRAAPPAEANVAPRSSRRLAPSMGSYSQQKIATIVGHGGVVMDSNRVDSSGRLLRRLQVAGETLVYDPNLVQVIGKGTMIAEDYRPPDPNHSARAATQPTQDLQRPQQTIFLWDRGMNLSLSPKDRVAVIDGNVEMVHCSGQYVQAEGVNHPAWPEMKNGRLTKLRSDRLQAFFAESAPSAGAPGRPDSFGLEGGPRIGEPNHIYAIGNVFLVDGVRQNREIVGQQLEYKRNPESERYSEVVIVLGSLEGQPKANAAMVYKDLDARPNPTRQEWSGLSIKWSRAKDGNDRVEVEGGSGTGMRR